MLVFSNNCHPFEDIVGCSSELSHRQIFRTIPRPNYNNSPYKELQDRDTFFDNSCKKLYLYTERVPEMAKMAAEVGDEASRLHI